MKNDIIIAEKKGNAGEDAVSRILSGFNRKQYIVINNVLLRKPYSYEGDIPTVQIDHIVVSIYGIFSIETKNYSGRVYGNEDSKTWAVYVGGKKYQMQNPLRQNYAHSKTLQTLLSDNALKLGIDQEQFSIYQIIAFSDKTDITKVDVSGASVVHFSQVPEVIIQKSLRQCLSAEQMESIARYIESINIYSPETMRQHVSAIVSKREEPVRKNGSWDLSVGGDSDLQEYSKYEYLPDMDNRYAEPKNYTQYETDEDIKYKSKKNAKGGKRILVVTLILLALIVVVFIICCCGGNGFLACVSGKPSPNGSTSKDITSSTSSKITTYNQLDEDCLDLLYRGAYSSVEAYIDDNSRDEQDYKDQFDSLIYLGTCFGYSEDGGNELYYIFKLRNTTEAIDNVNLRKYSIERPVYYYQGYKDIAQKSDGSYDYTITEPEVLIPDFTSKSIYRVNNYKFIHTGYMFITDMFSDIESKYASVEYYPNKEELVNGNHKDEYDITNYSDNLEHASFVDCGGYVDAGGEEYNGCINAYFHSAFTDPTCADYRIGTEYNTLSFKYTPNQSLFYSNDVFHIAVIDKDTFETIYETEDLVVGKTGEAVVDVTGHKNIRLQVVATSGNAGQVLIKDIILSN